MYLLVMKALWITDKSLAQENEHKMLQDEFGQTLGRTVMGIYIDVHQGNKAC